MGYTILTGIWEEVDAEIHRASRKHGDKSMRARLTHDAIAPLVEEVGEVAKAECDRFDGRSTWEGGTAQIRTELLHVAASAVAMIQHIDDDDKETPA